MKRLEVERHMMPCLEGGRIKLNRLCSSNVNLTRRVIACAVGLYSCAVFFNLNICKVKYILRLKANSYGVFRLGLSHVAELTVVVVTESPEITVVCKNYRMVLTCRYS